MHYYPLQIHRISSPSSSSPNLLDAKICDVACRALQKLAVALIANGTVMAFTFGVTVPSIPLMSTAVVGVCVGIVVETAWKLYSNRLPGGIDPKDVDGSLPFSSHAHDLAGISLANTIGLAGANFWIHEGLGHACAAWACFKKAQAKVVISPFQWGSTSYSISYGLTRLGELLGKEGSLTFITAAGMMASTVFGMMEFALADGIKDSYPTISECLTYHGIAQIMNEVIYGITALLVNSPDLSNDFIRLWILDEIHPLLPIALMITLPVLEMLLIKFLRSKNTVQNVHQLAMDKI